MTIDWLEKPLSLARQKIWIAGHTGMVGSALVRRLESEPCQILTVPRADLDLRHQADVKRWVVDQTPDMIVLAAATVGGILANAEAPADFLYDNLMIASNVIRAAEMAGVKKLLFLGSSCMYPKYAEQPISEEALLGGALESTNEAYAVAKIAGLKLCQAYRTQHGCDFISAIPCNLYGPNDNFDAHTSHVIPALIRKALVAKAQDTPFTVWGTGIPRREFMYVDDLADALVFMLKNYSSSKPLNVGAGYDMSIAELASLIATLTEFTGTIQFDPSKPDGTPAKLMNSERLYNAGWQPPTDLITGLQKTIEWCKVNRATAIAA